MAAVQLVEAIARAVQVWNCMHNAVGSKKESFPFHLSICECLITSRINPRSLLWNISHCGRHCQGTKRIGLRSVSLLWRQSSSEVDTEEVTLRCLFRMWFSQTGSQGAAACQEPSRTVVLWNDSSLSSLPLLHTALHRALRDCWFMPRLLSLAKESSMINSFYAICVTVCSSASSDGGDCLNTTTVVIQQVPLCVEGEYGHWSSGHCSSWMPLSARCAQNQPQLTCTTRRDHFNALSKH